MLEGKLAIVTTVAFAALIALVEQLPKGADAIVYAAAVIGGLKILRSTLGGTARRLREVHEAVTSDLPGRMDKVEERLEDGEVHFARIDASLETMANVDRARVQGWAEARRAPRPARATDPDPATEQRVWAFAPWDR